MTHCQSHSTVDFFSQCAPLFVVVYSATASQCSCSPVCRYSLYDVKLNACPRLGGNSFSQCTPLFDVVSSATTYQGPCSPVCRYSLFSVKLDVWPHLGHNTCSQRTSLSYSLFIVKLNVCPHLGTYTILHSTWGGCRRVHTSPRAPTTIHMGVFINGAHKRFLPYSNQNDSVEAGVEGNILYMTSYHRPSGGGDY